MENQVERRINIMKQEKEKGKPNMPPNLIREWDEAVKAATMLKNGTGRIVTKGGRRYVTSK